jgi:hypothetical protein
LEAVDHNPSPALPVHIFIPANEFLPNIKKAIKIRNVFPGIPDLKNRDIIGIKFLIEQVIAANPKPGSVNDYGLDGYNYTMQPIGSLNINMYLCY